MHAIVGAGTGLGIARGIISGEKVKVLASEGGHVEYSPKSKLEWDLKMWLKNYLKVERISCERIISGTGLSRIAEWRLSKPDAQNHPLQQYLKKIKTSDAGRKELPEKICNLSKEGDQIMIEVEKIWLGTYALYWEMLLFKNCALADCGFLEEQHQNISKTLNQTFF